MRTILTGLLLAACVASAARAQPFALGTGISYQGQLRQNGAPLNGSINLMFSLWDAPGAGAPPAGGSQIGNAQLATNVLISNGLFTVTLNDAGQFGSTAFNGQARWLQVEVCSDATCSARTILAPRQSVTPAPYATFAAKPWSTSGSDIFYTTGNASIGTNSTTSGLQIKHEPVTASGTLALEGATHTYMSFYPDGFLAGRKGFFGFACGSCNDISLTNQIIGGGIGLAPGAGGSVDIGVGSAVHVDGAGRVGIGTFAPRVKLEIDSSVPEGLLLQGVGETVMQFGLPGYSRHGGVRWLDQFLIQNDYLHTGVAVLGDDGGWTNGSDRRLKSDITPAEGLLEKALALRPVEFFMKNQDCARNPYKYLGLIAQDVQPILPALVHGSDPLTLSYDRIGVVAIGAIREQQQLISCQQRVLAEQRERIKELEGICAALRAAAEREALRTNDLAARVERIEAAMKRSTGAFAVAQPDGVSNGGFGLFVRNVDNNFQDAPFHFIAVGPR